MSGGISFRGFVEELQVASETAQASEAPILEEDSDGVRMMTVHKAKGLEFPVVILADLTCRLSRPDAGRWIDPEGNVCALKLGGWAPIDLLLHGSEEAERDRAEGQRLAYVAATRARDLLVVPVVGDEIYEGGWLDPLMEAVYPSPFAREARAAGVGCPAFPSKDSVLNRPDGDPARPMTVAPGSYLFAAPAATRSSGGIRTFCVSTRTRATDCAATTSSPRTGIRRQLRLALPPTTNGGTSATPQRPVPACHRCACARRRPLPPTGRPTLRVDIGIAPIDIEVIDFSRTRERPFGARFGSLVHATLATVPLDAPDRVIAVVAEAQSRILPAAARDPYAALEVDAAVEVVSAVLKAPLFDQVRLAERDGRCDRELPITWMAPDGTLIEGTIDLAFEDVTGVTVIDFKTDRELATDLERYRRQLTVYCEALATTRNVPARGILARV